MTQAQSVAQLRADLAPVLDLSDDELRALIPERAGLRFTGCPNCTGGTQENQLWWSIGHPHEVYCQHCDLRYPNDTYADDQVLCVTDALGQTQQYPYWDDADGYHHFFQAKGWYVARLYFEDAALKLARLYVATQDSSYARRAALILQRFAEVYPGYLVHYDYPFQQKILWSAATNFPYPVADFRAAKWSWWAYMDISEDLLLAYELVRDTLDEATQQQLEVELFHAMVDFIHNYPPALTNMDPTLLRALITAGRVLHEPAYMHDAVRRIELLVQQQFFADGAWREGALSYHNQTVRGLDLLVQLLDGYSDPPGYTPVAGAARFDDLNLTRKLPILARARRVPDLLRYPNGRVVAFHDTWAREQAEPLSASQAMLLPDLGQARLGRGEGDGQMQAHLHFSGGYGHQHADVLSLSLFAQGQERLSDIGYTHTRHRAWTLTTLSHNTVTVDGQDQFMGSQETPSDGTLRLFVPGDDDVLAAVEAGGERAYPGLVDVYRRMLLLVGAADDGYVVDLFHVVGGSRHDYVLLGDADHDGTLVHDMATRPYGAMLLPEGVSVNWPTGESVAGDAEGHNLGYAYIGDVQQVSLAGPWQATFTSDAPVVGGVRVHGLGGAMQRGPGPDDVLFTARAPSIRQAREDDAALAQYDLPMLVQRREAAPGTTLASTFVHVLECYGAAGPFIDSVERLPVSFGSGVAVRVRWGEVTDLLLLGAEAETVLEVAGVRLLGRVGFVRLRHGRAEQMRLVGGTSLQAAGRELQGAGIVRGRVMATLRQESGQAMDALITDLPMASLPDVMGLWAIVIDGAGFHHGHQIIGAAAADDGGAVLQLADDPGYDVTVDGGRQVYFPGRRWQGETAIEITTLASWSTDTVH
ncbi:MAG: heparinase II/III family protein [bacterium]|nr:heparinase II/III family protein [bacterium]